MSSGDPYTPSFADLAKAVAPSVPARLRQPLSVYACLELTERLKAIVPTLLDLTALPPADALTAISSGVVVIEHNHGEAQAVIAAVAATRPDLSMLVIGNDLPVQVVRAMLRFSASDVVPANSEPQDIIDAAADLSASALAAAPTTAAKVWAFRGAVGGAGVTTIAIETAAALARRDAGKSVCLLDLNICDAMTPAFLDGQPKLDIAAICEAPDRLDETLLRAYGWTHKSGVVLLANKRDPRAETGATEDAILQLLETACATFDHIIIDLPRHNQPWTEAIMSGVDEVIIVSELTVPSLHAAADSCREIDRVRGHLTPARLVLNRMYTKKRFQTAFPIEKAERAIQRDIKLTISSDWDAARTAVNLGMPIADVKAKSPMVADVLSFVEILSPSPVNDNQDKSGLLRRAG